MVIKHYSGTNMPKPRFFIIIDYSEWSRNHRVFSLYMRDYSCGYASSSRSNFRTSSRLEDPNPGYGYDSAVCFPAAGSMSSLLWVGSGFQSNCRGFRHGPRRRRHHRIPAAFHFCNCLVGMGYIAIAAIFVDTDSDWGAWQVVSSSSRQSADAVG